MSDFFDNIEYVDVVLILVIIIILFYLYVERDKLMNVFSGKTTSSALPTSTSPTTPTTPTIPQIIKLDIIPRLESTDIKSINISSTGSCPFEEKCVSKYVLELSVLEMNDINITPVGHIIDPFYVVFVNSAKFIFVMKATRQIKNCGSIFNNGIDNFIKTYPDKGQEIIKVFQELENIYEWGDPSTRYYIFPPTPDLSQILSQFRGEVINIEA